MSIIIKEECPKCGSVGGLFVCSMGGIDCADCGEFIRMAKPEELDQMEPVAKAFKKKREEGKMKTENIVPFKRKDVKAYLDKCIRKWRRIGNDKSDLKKEMAIYYIDAFQSVRISLFGELLPKEEKSNER